MSGYKGWENYKPAVAAKPSKYRSQKITNELGTFDSKREYQRFYELTLMQRGGLIRNLARQARFDLYGVNGEVVAFYLADFTYERLEPQNVWKAVVEDAKGFRTPVYQLKKKLLRAQGVFILET